MSRKVILIALAWLPLMMLMMAHANTSHDSLRQFGLEGHWAAHCSSPPGPGPDKVHFHFVIPNEAPAMVTVDLGDGKPLPYALTYATSLPDDKMIVTGIAITDLYVAQIFIMYAKKGGKIRMMNGTIKGVANRTASSIYGDLSAGKEFSSGVVSDGRLYFHNNAEPVELPWLEKCPQQ